MYNTNLILNNFGSSEGLYNISVAKITEKFNKIVNCPVKNGSFLPNEKHPLKQRKQYCHIAYAECRYLVVLEAKNLEILACSGLSSEWCSRQSPPPPSLSTHFY